MKLAQFFSEFFQIMSDLLPQDWKDAALAAIDRVEEEHESGTFRKWQKNILAWFFDTTLLTVGYFAEMLRLSFDLILVIIAAYLRFGEGLPPALAILPDGMWVVGGQIIAYVCFIIFTYGFAMQEFVGYKEQELYGRDRAFPLLALLVGDVAALLVGVPEAIVVTFSLILLTSFLVKDYSEQGRYGVVPFTIFPLRFLAFWIVVLTDVSDAYTVKVAVAGVSKQGWIALFFFALFLIVVLIGSAWLGKRRIKKAVTPQS
jgi:hypothetical protein